MCDKLLTEIKEDKSLPRGYKMLLSNSLSVLCVLRLF